MQLALEDSLAGLGYEKIQDTNERSRIEQIPGSLEDQATGS